MRLLVTFLLVVLAAAAGYAQLTETANHNVYLTKLNWTGPDTLTPWAGDQGMRSVWVAQDLDKDGKPEVLATDYANLGRVHVFEMTTPGTLELVWSSPRHTSGGGSTPRWVVDGDLDGDGNREIIFPRSNSDATDGDIQVFEYTGTDNDFGTMPAIILPRDLFVPLGTLNFRTNRERGTVYDFDGDGRDELITANRDHKVYILGISGDIPGFGSWQLEGGDPAVHPENRFSGGSWWHSVPADIDGDGTKEIVTHYWNFYGFWSIDPLGPDSYRYPTPGVDSATVPAAKTDFYHEYTRPWGDAVSYMGIVPIDVDGDGKQELAGVAYDAGPIAYYPVLTGLAMGDTGVYVWRDSTQFGVIGEALWTLAGYTSGSHWGTGAYDFNGNGREEYLLGGSALFNVTALEYKGTGSIFDKANYDATIIFPGDVALYHEIDFRDSLGVKVDTVRAESPFVSKMFVPADLDGDTHKEIVLAYQSVADSIRYRTYHWDTTAVPNTYVLDSTWREVNTNAINMRVVEYTGATGFTARDLNIVLPEDYVLEQNYPNPFNPSTTIRFTLPVTKKISVVVFDITGREVRTLIGDEVFENGTHAVTWDGRDNGGMPVASGQYIYSLRYGNFSKSQKMTLLK